MGQFSTIKSKLVIGFFLIASFVVIVGTVGFVNSLHINSAFNFVTNDTLPKLLVLDNIQSSINKISSDIVGFALGSSEAKALHQKRLQQMIQDNKTLTTYIDQFGKITQPNEMRSYRPICECKREKYKQASHSEYKVTGYGIDREMISRLFTKFATKSFDGTGLGLYISRSIIEAHGGIIWAEDNDDGTKGATFSFSLPKLSSYNQR